MSETPRTDALRKQFEYWTNATDRFHDEEQEKFWKMVEEMERAIANEQSRAHIEMRNFRRALRDLASVLQEPAASQLLDILYPEVAEK